MSSEVETRDAAQQLQDETIGCRLTFTRLGATKAFDSEHLISVGAQFGAEAGYLRASKRLLNTSHPKYKAITTALAQARGTWVGMTFPFPESGVRLLNRERVGELNERIEEHRRNLEAAIAAANEVLPEIVGEARKNLGELFNEEDYPETLQGCWGIEVSFPSITPPDYLAELNPNVYRQELARARGRIDEAIALTESAFAEELLSMTRSLQERLEPEETRYYTWDGDSSAILLEAYGELQEQARLATVEATQQALRLEASQLELKLLFSRADTIRTIGDGRIKLGFPNKEFCQQSYPGAPAKKTITYRIEQDDETMQEVLGLCNYERSEIKQRQFQRGTVEHFRDFFDRFASLNISNSLQLANAVEQARGALEGVTAEGLRDDQSAAERLREAMAEVSESIETVERPRRRLDL